MSSEIEIQPNVETNIKESKLNRILQGPVRTFPGNASLMQFFYIGFAEHRIHGERTALIVEETHHTYDMLNEISSKIAHVIRSHLDTANNANPDGDTVIGICIPPSDTLIFTIFAILKLGAAYVPFDLTMPEERIVKIVNNCKPLLIISDSQGNTMSKFDVVSDTVKVIGYGDLADIAEKSFTDDGGALVEPLPGLPNLAERTALVLYTSGSSGEPKGVRLSHRAVLNRLSWQWKVMPYTSNDRLVFKTSLTFVDSVSEIFCPLLQGYPLVVFNKLIVQNPSVFVQRLNTFSITRVVLVPSLLKAIFQTLKLLENDERKKLLTSVRLWVASGETLQKDLVEEFFTHFYRNSQLANFYGSTEIMGDVTFVVYDNKKAIYDKTFENQIPIGECLFNTVVYVLDGKLELTPAGESGEIFIAGYNLATGYVGLPESDKFISNPYSPTAGFNRLYRTGDFGKIVKTHDGTRMVVFEGRIDSQIKVRGQRVDLNEIEYVITQLHFVKKAVVLCHHPGLSDQAILAFILADPDVTVERVNGMLVDKIREYEMPVIRLVDEIPYLINGKTDRQRLLRSYQLDQEKRDEFDDWNSLTIPEADAAAGKVLIKTISAVTGRAIQDIVDGLDDSFYNLGGSSLNSIEVVLKLRENNYNISVSDFVSAKSILEIIDQMLETNSNEEEEEDVEVEDKSPYIAEKFNNSFQEDVIKIIGSSFSVKGDLEQYTNATYEEFVVLIKSIWKELVQKGFSFVVKRKDDGQIVGASLNFDVYDEPPTVDASPAISYVLEMLEFIESRQREKLPKGKGKLIHCFMMGTRKEIDDSENVIIIQFMEENVIKMGRSLNFLGVLTTNTNPLTAAICRDLHGYESLSEYQVNRYLAPDGTKPFLLAPDSFKIICCWKKLDNLSVLDDI